MLKQFALVNKKPLLLHTFDAFLQWGKPVRFILVLAGSMVKQWAEICSDYHFTTKHLVVTGGQTRLQSVKNGLKHIPDNAMVAIHDGARPLVSSLLIEEGFSLAAKTGSAIPVVKISDSVRKTAGTNSRPVNRKNLLMVQTPQFFQSSLIKKAYDLIKKENFTDDASLFETAGHKLSLYQGDRQNIKITFQEDLNMMEALLK